MSVFYKADREYIPIASIPLSKGKHFYEIQENNVELYPFSLHFSVSEFSIPLYFSCDLMLADTLRIGSDNGAGKINTWLVSNFLIDSNIFYISGIMNFTINNGLIFKRYNYFNIFYISKKENPKC